MKIFLKNMQAIFFSMYTFFKLISWSKLDQRSRAMFQEYISSALLKKLFLNCSLA